MAPRMLLLIAMITSVACAGEETKSEETKPAKASTGIDGKPLDGFRDWSWGALFEEIKAENELLPPVKLDGDSAIEGKVKIGGKVYTCLYSFEDGQLTRGYYTRLLSKGDKVEELIEEFKRVEKMLEKLYGAPYKVEGSTAGTSPEGKPEPFAEVKRANDTTVLAHRLLPNKGTLVHELLFLDREIVDDILDVYGVSIESLREALSEKQASDR